MANEITYQVLLNLQNGNLSEQHRTTMLQADQSVAGLQRSLQNIGTTHEALALGAVSTPGMGILCNTNDTNFIEVGIDASGVFHATLKLKPGELQLVRFAGAPYAKSDVAACDLFYIIYED